MTREQFCNLKRGDLVRVGRHLRIVQLGPADFRRDSDRYGGPLSVYFGKIRSNGYFNGATVYLYSDRCMKESRLVKSGVGRRALAADIARVTAMGFRAARDAARVRRAFGDRLLSGCAR